KGHRPRHVDFSTVVIPGPCRSVELELEVIQRTFTHGVDDTARVTGASEQAGRPFQHFDMVELGQVISFVGIEGTDTRTDVHRRGAINLDVVDTKTTRDELWQTVVGAFNGNARRAS